MAWLMVSDPDDDPPGGLYPQAHIFAAGNRPGAVRPNIVARLAAFEQSRGLNACPITREIDHALIALRKAGRQALRVLDVGCEDGGWLIETVLHAPMLGFVAIEGRGFDTVAAMVERARSTAAGIHDPRIGLSFDVADVAAALADEDDHGADIVLCHYGLLARLPLDCHEHVVAELARVTAGTLICLGGAQ
ncbi:methyltransferase domain-containing protein [Sphingomonas crusticola]|uniref:methyltransferase domain-containing protein n=1 Tax=Sphingomonas crusticola TaxID=1697973 RepID=UPI0013C34002|nr:methyltransferase domain-containing protein [Sphingomonas crusticola]